MNSSRVAACALRNMIRNLRCTVTIDSVLANSKTQKAFLFTVNSIFLHDYPLAVELGSTPRPLVQNKTWRDSLPIDMLLSSLSVLVVAQSSSEIPEGLMNNPVRWFWKRRAFSSLWTNSDLYKNWWKCLESVQSIHTKITSWLSN